MAEIEERYISLLTGFGFNRIFGTKPNKDLLINFLNSLFDKWQYVLKNLSFLDKRPKALQEKIFSRLFSEASIARFTPDK